MLFKLYHIFLHLSLLGNGYVARPPLVIYGESQPDQMIINLPAGAGHIFCFLC